MQQQKPNVGYRKEYEIQLDKELGSGAYGKVYECQHIYDRNLKLCAKIVQINETEEKNLQREKEINELISQQNYNPNLVRVFYVGQETYGQGKVLVFVMEKCDSNLQKLMDQRTSNQPFSTQELDSLIRQLLNGYSVLYNKNIVHRDIKPENILIKYEQNQIVYKLADFGVGKVYKANDFKMTKAGTPVFSSPEINVIYSDKDLEEAFTQFSKEGKTKSCVDIFSIGIILYKLASTTYPFPTTREGIIQFFRTIKTNPQTVNIQYYIHKQMIEGMLRYFPEDRTTFAQLFQYYQTPINVNNPIFINQQKLITQQKKFDINQIQQQFNNTNQNQFGNNMNQNNNQQQQPFIKNFVQSNQNNNFQQQNLQQQNLQQPNFQQQNLQQPNFQQQNLQQPNFQQQNLQQPNFQQQNLQQPNFQQQNLQQPNFQQQNLQQPNFQQQNQQQQNLNNINQQQNLNNINQLQTAQNNQNQNNNQFQQGGSQRFTMPANQLNFRQTITTYIKIFSIQYDKIISEQFKPVSNQINFSGITTIEQIKFLKNQFFPIKKEDLQQFRPEHIAFLYSIACLEKNFQEQFGSQSPQQQLDYLNKNLF